MTSYTEAEAYEKLKDPKFFIERFLFIINKNRERVPFLFNNAQKIYYANRSKNDLILKSRKEGLSSVVEAIWLHGCIFGKNENCVTMAQTWDDTVIHMDRVKYFIETMGISDIKFDLKLDKENQREILFPHSNSRYWIGTAGSTTFGRGRDITKLHLSEVAHYQDPAVMTGIMEACIPNAVKILETTANGVGDTFHRLWQEAGDPQSGSPWKQHFFAWHDDPENRKPKPLDRNVVLTSTEKRLVERYKLDVEQILWYRFKTSEAADRSKIPQEYPSNPQEAFLSSGHPAFNLEKLNQKRERIKDVKPLAQGEFEDDGQKISFRHDPEGRLKVWKMPRRGAQYLIPADVSEGVQGGNWSVFPIYDRSSWEQVATWRGRLDPGDFGREMVKAGIFYNNAVLVPELNNHGHATIEAIEAEQYPHILETKELWGDKEPNKKGFPQTEKHRAFIITALRNAIDDDTVFFNDITTLSELETFVRSDGTGRFEAQEGCFDDCVIANGIGIYCLKFLTVDDTYGDHVTHRNDAPLSIVSIVGRSPVKQNSTNQKTRRSVTGYR